ncbi:MAG: hypothetical protein ABSG60_01030 [Terracidiphilus sp.]|jgi:hypothetical protein
MSDFNKALTAKQTISPKKAQKLAALQPAFHPSLTEIVILPCDHAPKEVTKGARTLREE